MTGFGHALLVLETQSRIPIEHLFPELFLLYLAVARMDKRPRKLAPVWRVMVEVGFIVFLFYSNLLMGEFTRTNSDAKSLVFALKDIFTAINFVIAIVSGLIGFVLFEFLRKRV